MQNMQTSEFLHLLGHSSGSAGSWDVFRGRWHNTAISGILLWRCVLSRVGWGVFLHYFPSSFSISSTCQVGHLDLEILLSHISSNFCDVFCWTLHPPRAVVCRPRQTREDVHILVATIQWSSDTVATWYVRNLNGSHRPKTSYCPKTWVFASLAGFLQFHTNNGFLHWKIISNFRHLALYSKQFQTFNFAPKFQNS